MRIINERETRAFESTVRDHTQDLAQDAAKQRFAAASKQAEAYARSFVQILYSETD